MKKLLAVMILLYPLSALAVTYEWTDERGTVSFTEDLGNVPKKYRKKAKVLGAEESDAPRTDAAAEPAKAKPAVADEVQTKKQYGGKDEKAWRAEFAAARRELQQAETELADLRARLNDTSKMSRSEYLTIRNTINPSESRVPALKKKLDLLKESADRAGVPADARQ